MNMLISELYEHQYKFYLNCDQKRIRIIKNSSKFNIILKKNLEMISLVINRLAYFILNKFRLYPNNLNLFQRFKIYPFDQISNQNEYRAIKSVFDRFTQCHEIKQQELIEIKRQLDIIHNILFPQMSDLSPGCVQERQKSEDIESFNIQDSTSAIDLINNSATVELEDLSHTDHLVDLNQDCQQGKENNGSEVYQVERIDQKNPDLFSFLSQKPEVIQLTTVTEVRIEDNNLKEVNYSSVNENLSSSSQEETPVDTSDLQQEEQSSDSSIVQTKEDSELKEKNESILQTCHSIEEEQPEELLSKKEHFLQTTNPILTIQTVSEDPLSQLTAALNETPEYIKKIYEEKLIDFSELKRDAKKSRHYQGQLVKLLEYVERLRKNNHLSNNIDLKSQMQDRDRLFQEAYKIDRETAVEIHHKEFKKIEWNCAPPLFDNGKMLCSTDQFDWLIKILHKNFLFIYESAFDIPEFEIFQKTQLVQLAQIIFFGKDYPQTDVNWPTFIRLHEVNDRTTYPLIKNGDTNPLTENGSFIYTNFIRSHVQHVSDQIDSNSQNIRKDQLERFVAEFVKDWLLRPGITLKFAQYEILSGQSTQQNPTIDWSVCVRDFYTKRLYEMNKEELNSEIQQLETCPLLNFIIDTYQSDLSQDVLEQSTFPSAFLDRLLENQLKSADDKSKLYESIQSLITHSHFQNLQTIQDLALKADCEPKKIEPLIRVKLIYLMGCLGQTIYQPVIQGCYERFKKMYDPYICQDVDDKIISCDAQRDRTLIFDPDFNSLSINVKLMFKDPYRNQIIASGTALLTVNSIYSSRVDTVETTVSDLQDLCFNLYPLLSERKYLTAQVNPEMFVKEFEDYVDRVLKMPSIQAFKTMSSEKGFLGLRAKAPRWNDEKNKNLEAIGYVVKECEFYLNTLQTLYQFNQLNSKQLYHFKDQYELLCKEINETFNHLKNIYKKEKNQFLFIIKNEEAIQTSLNYQKNAIEKIFQTNGF